MEMKAIEAITIGEDLTPPLRPLAAALRHSALTTHCSACFSPLPADPVRALTRVFPERFDDVSLLAAGIPSPLYCSIQCATIDSTLHSESHEQRLLYLIRDYPLSSWPESAVLRLALRIACILQKLPQECRFLPAIPFLGVSDANQRDLLGGDEVLERIIGLMTNRRDLILTVTKRDDKNLEKIREGVAIIALARGNGVEVGHALEEIALCLVMTNGVEVHDMDGRLLGFAVYDHRFSWINHSCSPNSCYGFLFGREENDEQQQQLMRMAPAGEEGRIHRDVYGSVIGNFSYPVSVTGNVERNGYGPRLVVRSIKSIRSGEGVTVAYTDLLLPTETRQAELWSKYRFNCSCERCEAVPKCYADTVLPALSADSPDDPETEEMRQLMQNVNFVSTICDYDSNKDSQLCCSNLEYLLCCGDFSHMSLEPLAAELPQKRKLHLFHYYAINAYIALASAYKDRGNNLSALNCEDEAINMKKTCSAYSLLLAGVVNHLFTYEPSIVTSAENCWMGAGGSLLRYWYSAFMKDMPQVALSSLLTLDCANCSLLGDLDPNQKETHLTEMKSQLYDCIAKITPRVWRFLTSESKFLKSIQNPVDLSWVETRETLGLIGTSRSELGLDLVELGLHCLKYGALLSSICYGKSVDAHYRRALDAVMQT